MAKMKEIEQQSVLTLLRSDIQTGNVPLDQVTFSYISSVCFLFSVIFDHNCGYSQNFSTPGSLIRLTALSPASCLTARPVLPKK